MPSLSITSHLLAGGLAFVFFWGAVLTVKGSPLHRRFGRLFFLSLLPVGLTVGALLLLRSDTFDPARLVQFIYLLLCLLTIGTVGWTAIRWKGDLERFRGTHFKVLGPVLFVSGAVVLAAGILSRQPLAVILSSIGLVFGAAMIRFAWLRAPVHPKWWLGWHLSSVFLLLNAVHGSLLALAYRTFIDATGYEAAQLVTQPATLLLALALRIYVGRQRGVPMRFSDNALQFKTTPAATSS